MVYTAGLALFVAFVNTDILYKLVPTVQCQDRHQEPSSSHTPFVIASFLIKLGK